MNPLSRHPRVVLDTNCLLQIMGFHSPYHVLWKAFLEGRFTLCISNEIIHEYEEILRQRTSERVVYLLMQVLARSTNVFQKDPYFRFNLITADPDDNKFVDCAIITGADYIVTEDSHFRVLENIKFPHVRVIRLNDFMHELGY